MTMEEVKAYEQQFEMEMNTVVAQKVDVEAMKTDL